VLRLYLAPDLLPQRLTTLRLFTRPQADMRQQAQALLPGVQAAVDAAFGNAYAVASEPMFSQIGSGALPIDTLPSHGLVIRPTAAKARGRQLLRLEEALRRLPRPVIGRIAQDALWLDLRCLEAGEQAAFEQQLSQLGRQHQP
jgi:L-seryl-tRNA(Ser) seleniumtransferase